METGKQTRIRRYGCSLIDKAGLIALASLWAVNGVPPAYSDVATVSQTLQAQLFAVGKVSVPSSLTLKSTGTVFSPYVGSLNLRYRIRSTPSGTGGNITVQATGDFSPSGGPSISNGPLTYTCSAVSLGTPCSGVNSVSLSSQTNVATIPPAACTGGGAPCSAVDPNSLTIDFSLENDPSFKTGNYSAVVTFTISST
ncbi:MAG: hypothetical protein A3F68_07990 [Acidobacteria bacterium RIFCSPLOWO2_12_FULL_54_10]|nr:MAG: hypothetical protein A3F68_07990 [Acidobacteria bacterium RIFCSPLOWO2_12_FULL_54_10]